MEAFRADGHLTDEALAALTRDPGPDGLTRLEIAEHMAYCDLCLQRYTALLESLPLLVPERSCQKGLWARVRTRALRLAASRYTTAAAAVALALTVLWGGRGVEVVRPALTEDRPSVSRQLTEMTGNFGDSLRGAVGGLSDFFEGLSYRHMIEGGNEA